MATQVLLDPGVPDLAALGAPAAEAWLEGFEAPGGELVTSDGGREVRRVPLPGTLSGRPRGAGTGWVLWIRYGPAALAERLFARFTHPRSDSLAGREWNLFCALRRAGVATPAPLALVWEEHPLFAPRSALVTRALEGATPLEAWFARAGDPARRRRACTALGLALARMGAAGIDLPLAPGRLLLLEDEDPTRPASPADACGLEQVLAARRAPVDVGRPVRWRRLPEVVVADARGGRIRRHPTTRRLVARLARDPGAADLGPDERRRVARAAAGNPGERRALLATPSCWNVPE